MSLETFSQRAARVGDYQDADRRLSAVIQAYWTNFARTGNPNATGLPRWPGFDAKKREYLVFTASGDVTAAANERGAFCDLFRALLSGPAAPH